MEFKELLEKMLEVGTVSRDLVFEEAKKQLGPGRRLTLSRYEARFAGITSVSNYMVNSISQYLIREMHFIRIVEDPLLDMRCEGRLAFAILDDSQKHSSEWVDWAIQNAGSINMQDVPSDLGGDRWSEQ